MARKRSTEQKTVRMTRQSVKRVIPKITSWKSRGARAPVPHSWRRQCWPLTSELTTGTPVIPAWPMGERYVTFCSLVRSPYGRNRQINGRARPAIRLAIRTAAWQEMQYLMTFLEWSYRSVNASRASCSCACSVMWIELVPEIQTRLQCRVERHFHHFTQPHTDRI